LLAASDAIVHPHLAFVDPVDPHLLTLGKPISPHLLPLHDPGRSVVYAIDPHLLAVGGANLLALDPARPHRRPLMPLRLDHPELRRPLALDSSVGVATVLKCERLPRRAGGRKAWTALHAECRAIATAPATALHAHAVTAAMKLGRAPVAMPATVSAAGLRTRRRRNRQSGDARGKE
jgi:hypothetical protein